MCDIWGSFIYKFCSFNFHDVVLRNSDHMLSKNNEQTVSSW